MLSRYTSIIFTLLVPMALLAQPTITRDWIGKANDQIVTSITVETPDEGEAGADRMWDFSSVTSDTFTLGFSYVDPAGTPFADMFPNSNLSLAQSKIGIYQYLEVTDDIFQNWGTALLTSSIKYDDPEVQLMFPFGYEDTFQDDYSKIEELFGVAIYSTGKVDVTADAYGTVILPGGAFDNVMRVKIVDTSVDSTDLGLGIIEKIHATTTTYIWYSAEHPGPLCYRDYTESYQVAIVPPLPNDTMQLDPDSSFAFDPTATSSSIEYFKPGNLELSVSPNPFIDQLQVEYVAERATATTIELTTVSGQTVFAREVQSIAGINRFSFEPGHLAPGSYTLLVKMPDQGALKQLVKVE